MGLVYEYFLGQFATAEGKKGGQFYTPAHVVKTLVVVLAPHKGRVYDPCCGSGGMFVQSEKFVESHGGRRDDISVYGQESNPTTWRLTAMNLAIRGFAADRTNLPTPLPVTSIPIKRSTPSLPTHRLTFPTGAERNTTATLAGSTADPRAMQITPGYSTL